MGKKDTYIEVETNKRSYGMVKDGKVAWEKGEKVVRIEPKEKGKGGK